MTKSVSNCPISESSPKLSRSHLLGSDQWRKCRTQLPATVPVTKSMTTCPDLLNLCSEGGSQPKLSWPAGGKGQPQAVELSTGSLEVLNGGGQEF
ncbi:hypothetical protein AXF42_Ash009241 [Apostasia shenzhenica]|uniref:Uncharacterized protein n=1 Tax=Apostasia shenzhenica TaxID=1088818 RepID=A0A2I0B3I8_9ASPA|nr:hypothetical protein AXF42_Ash009241 [Apostasia shenzhenica]